MPALVAETAVPPADTVSARPQAPGGKAGIDAYLNHIEFERKLSDHTLSNYRRDLMALLDLAHRHLQDLPLEQIEHHHIRRFAALLNSKGLAPRSIARTLSAWRTFYQWLAQRNQVQSNPVTDVRSPRPGKRLPKALSPDLAVQLVSQSSLKDADDATLALRDAAMFELFYSSGLRLSEVVLLDHSYCKLENYESAGWVSFESAEVTVTGKGRKRRIVPVGAPALVALKAWLEVREGFMKESAAPADRNALFISQRGKRLSGRSIELRLKAHAIRLGMPARVHPHMLRHSFASHVLQSSGDLRAVQEMLGHASIAATQVYTSLDFQRLAKVYDEAHPRAKKR